MQFGLKDSGLVLLVLAVAHSACASVQPLPFADHFTYTEGQLYSVATGIWDAGGSAGAELTVSNAAALTAPSGLTNASGKGIRWSPSGTSRRNVLQFSAVTNADQSAVYVSFLLSVQSAPSAARLIAFLESSSSSTTSPQLGIYVDNGPKVGIGKKASAPAFTMSTNLGTGPHLVIVRYTFITNGNDQADLWVDPPASTLSATNAPASLGSANGSSDPTSLSYFQLNTPSASSGGGLLYLDELRIGVNWADVALSGAASATPPSSAPHITRAFLGPQGFVLRGTNGTAGSLFNVLATSDLTVPVAQWNILDSDQFDGSGNFDWTNAVVPGASQQFYLLQAGGTAPAAPTIKTQPQSLETGLGQSAGFSVVALGSPPLRYQWYYNTNTTLGGSTNSSYNISSVSSNDLGAYSVIVTNNYGAITSAVATLSLIVIPTNGDFYVSPTGDDSNPGTFSQPFFTIAKAVSLAAPGNIIYVRGGNYFYSQTININTSGTASNTIKLWAAPGEHPLLDYVNQPYGDAYRAFVLTTNANWWHIKGLEVARAGDNGMKIEGRHNLIEQCAFHDCGDTGLQIGFSHTFVNDGSFGAYNEIVNCDGYHNYDSATRGGNADGLDCKLHPGKGNVFSGCRSWNNSDDGFDFFESDWTIVLSNCWTWHNGDKNLFPASSSFGGNGNGFKMGGNGSGGSSKGTHVAIRCVSFNNNFPNTSANGFTDNNHADGETVVNCVAFNNNYNFFFETTVNSGKTNTFINDVGFGSRSGVASGGTSFGGGAVIQSNDSWNLPVTASSADFGDLSEAAASAPRQADGSLPAGFARLVSGSDLMDKGLDIGLPFTGSAPDLGAYELGQ